MSIIQIKAYLLEQNAKLNSSAIDKVAEIRRFNIENNICLYDNLLDQIITHFKTELSDKRTIKTFYIDDENELVGFSSNNEFLMGFDLQNSLNLANNQASTNSRTTIFKVYIAKANQQSDQQESGKTFSYCKIPKHHEYKHNRHMFKNVLSNFQSSMNSIKDPEHLKRFGDYLKSVLEPLGVDIITKTDEAEEPKTRENEETPLLLFICSACNTKISGTRYKCAICKDYDLCSSCKSNGIHKDTEHKLNKIEESFNFCKFNKEQRKQNRQMFKHMISNFQSSMNTIKDPENLNKFCDYLKKVLEPLGVDVSTIMSDKEKPTESTSEDKNSSLITTDDSINIKTEANNLFPNLEKAGGSSVIDHEQETRITNCIENLKAMGFDDQYGWLSALVKSKDGNLNAVLDTLALSRGKQ